MTIVTNETSVQSTRSRGATVPLIVYSALYLLPLALSPSLPWTMGALFLAAVVATGAWLLARGKSPANTVASPLQQRMVAATAAAEGVALLISVVLALVLQAWWIVLPIVLSSVVAHLASMLWAYRRPFDYWALAWASLAAVAAWVFMSRVRLCGRGS